MLDFPLADSPVRPGLLVAPGDPGYDEARVAWNLAVDQRPAAVALPESADDVVTVVRHARDRGLRVTAQGTGHGASALGDLGDVMLIRTHRMRGVDVDPARRCARVEAGAQWQDVIVPAAEHGLRCLHGSAPDVGVVGYTLGGGLSFYARRHGLACEAVSAVELVTAAGELVRADRFARPDLLHAVRSGGGSFGIVTALEFELFDVGEVHGGVLWFPPERAAEVLQAWRAWAPTLPDGVATVARFLAVPPSPMAPEALRGKSFFLVEAVVLGDARDTEALLAPMRALGPAMDSVGPAPAEAVMGLHMDPPVPVPSRGDGWLLEELSPAAVDALVDAAGPDSGSSLVTVQIVLAGGAARRLGAPFAVYCVGMAPVPEAAAKADADVERIRCALAPWTADRAFANFAETPVAPERLWDAPTLERLRATREAVDPDHAVLANHAL